MIAETTSPDTFPLFWEDVVQAMGERARQALPQANGRIDKAIALVLSDGVTPLGNGKYQVASQRTPGTSHLTNGACDCAGYQYAPGHFCTHRLAAGIYRRATEYMQAQLATLDAPVSASAVAQAALPEAPASANVYIVMDGRKVQVTLRDTDETRLLQRMAAVLAQYPAPVPQYA